jgi:NAD(P)H-dependent FMN reductase
MKVLSIYGSPHDRGFSSSLHGTFLESFRSYGHDVREVHVYDEAIKPCTACGHCRDLFECIHDDIMNSLYPEILESTVISVSSPVYFSSLPGPLKNLIDRCQVLWERKRRDGVLPGERQGFIMLSSGQLYSNVFLPSLIVCRHFFNTIQCSYQEDEYVLLPRVESIDTVPAEAVETLKTRARGIMGRLSGIHGELSVN